MIKKVEISEFKNVIEQFKNLEIIDFINIENILNIKFEEKPVSNSGSFSKYYLDLNNQQGYFKELEFRKPNDKYRNNKGLIKVIMKLELEITQADIITNFGTPKFFLPPLNMLNNAIKHLTYNLKNLNLSFGFPHKGEDCLNSIVFDYYSKNIDCQL